MSNSMWYVQLRFSTFQRGRWVTFGCDSEPAKARHTAAALYRAAHTDEGEYPIGVRVVDGDRLRRAEHALALTA
jgi:hypothetical protein